MRCGLRRRCQSSPPLSARRNGEPVCGSMRETTDASGGRHAAQQGDYAKPAAASAPALSPPSLPVFAAVVDARRADLCARAMRGLGGSSTLQQKGEGVRRKIHCMAAPNPSPSCGGGGGGGGGGVGCFDGSGGGAPKNSLDGST